MRITKISSGHVAFDSSDDRTVNETIWNYRSACCGAPLDLVNGTLICASCGADVPMDIIHRGALKNAAEGLLGVVEAMPDGIKERATEGYYESLRGSPVSIVHIADLGGDGDPYELPQGLRR